MPSLESIREAARREQSQRVQQRLTASTPQNAQRRARAEQERAATKKWGHWGRELPPKHKERHLQNGECTPAASSSRSIGVVDFV